jgi:hypothetical protein
LCLNVWTGSGYGIDSLPWKSMHKDKGPPSPASVAARRATNGVEAAPGVHLRAGKGAASGAQWRRSDAPSDAAVDGSGAKVLRRLDIWNHASKQPRSGSGGVPRAPPSHKPRRPGTRPGSERRRESTVSPATRFLGIPPIRSLEPSKFLKWPQF